LLGSLLLIAPRAIGAQAVQQPAVKQVLVLQSVDRGNLTLDHFTNAFRVRLDQRAGNSVNVVQVVVGPAGSVAAPEQAVVDYIRSIYADRPPPDLIMSMGGPAAGFTRKHRRKLFPSTPLLLGSLDQRWLRDAPLGENETAVAVVNDYPRLITDILRILPETRQIFMVVGSGPLGHFWRRELETAVAPFRDRVTFVWSDGMSLPEILNRVSRLPRHSAVGFVSFSTDVHGGAYADAQVFADLHAKANAPLFGALTSQFGHGIVGGSLMSVDDLAHNTADVAGRILNGESPANLRVPPQVTGEPIFDWRELRRWHIPENRLPPGSSVLFRGPSLWEEHKVTALAAVGALFLQSLLIMWLLYERRARQRAELESRRNLALAADANRRETISALGTSIGHEFGQPLSAILHNTQALQMMVTANQAPPDVTKEILADIKAAAIVATDIFERHRTMLRSHQLQKQPIDLHAVIDESLALVAHDMMARRIEATLNLSSTPCVIDGDRVLLGQVFINLVRNAMDALDETPPSKRRIIIESAVRAADVDISVRDAGPGLPTEIIGTLFTPFVTTKTNGLGIGLTIAQRIVEAHAGTIAARENVNGGATFTVTLPRGVTPGSAEGGPAQEFDAKANVSSVGG
jgi:signal transduction histidine kinase